MADDKKPAGDKPAPSNSDPFVEIVWILLALFIAAQALSSLTTYFLSDGESRGSWRNLSPRGIILSSTKPISSIENPIGTKFVVTNRRIDVYDSPGGRKIDTKELGDKGTIIGGPVEIGGDRYWRVRFEDGSEGWVKESDIASIEDGDLSFTAKAVILLWKLLSWVKLLIVIISLVLVYFVFYLYRGIVKIRKEEHDKLYPGPLVETNVVSNNTNPLWEKILVDASSLNENDWRQAIMEADIMLGDLLDAMGLPGDTIGEKLKTVEKSDFLTVDLAWEAHKFRNNIAHEGSNFLINEREVKRVIDLYRQVFEEFHVI